jgi:universal stress protein E
MKRFKNILVVLDPEDEDHLALQRAVAVARLNQASLHVLLVLEALPLEMRMLVTAVHPQALQDIVERKQRARLDKWLAPLREDGIAVTTSLEWSNTPFLAIIRTVLRHQHDLVIKTVQRVTGPGAVLFHPTDRHLMRKCPCPLWMLKPATHPAYRRILAAVDPFPDEEPNNELNRTILELAGSLAAIEAADLHVVHAVQLVTGAVLYSPDVDAGVEVDMGQYRDEMLALHQQRMHQLLADYAIAAERVHIETGVPGEVIVDVARRAQADLIVTGTVARTGIPGLLIGNTAEQILDYVSCDVLAVKPRGFVTPVTLPA